MGNEVRAIDAHATFPRSEAPSSTIKSILLHVQNDANIELRLQTALAIARASGAHVACLQITPIEAYVTMGSLGGMYALDRWMKKIDAQEDQLRSGLEARLRSEDVTWDYEQLAGYAAKELSRRAALADLVITGREPHGARAQRPDLGRLGDLLSTIGTPLLLRGTAHGELDFFGRAVIAWNGSIEAANAARAAIGLMKLAREVRVIRYEEPKQVAFPDTSLVEYLSEHGIDAELDVRTAGGDLASELVDYAQSCEADYIVMGGYGHSRAGEYLFGGVTRTLLRDCPLSLVISH